jgi:hypothetical protein
MDYITSLKTTIAKIESEKATNEVELKRLEEEFANVKLNPYGITSIDFAKRQELSSDTLKMEGVLMGLQLALETFDETTRTVATAE